MARPMDKFCEDLRLKLTNIESGLGSLKTKIEGKAQQAEGEVRSRLDAVQRRIAQDHGKALAARAEIKAWIDSKKTVTADKIADWKAKRETSQLQNRAGQAERYAQATIDVALTALDEAEQATLEAWLASQEAKAAQSK